MSSPLEQIRQWVASQLARQRAQQVLSELTRSPAVPGVGPAPPGLREVEAEVARRAEELGEAAGQILLDARDTYLAAMAAAERERNLLLRNLYAGIAVPGAVLTAAGITLHKTLYPTELARNLRELVELAQRGPGAFLGAAYEQLKSVARFAAQSPKTALPQLVGAAMAGTLLAKLFAKAAAPLGGRAGELVGDWLPDILQGDPLGLLLDAVHIPMREGGRVLTVKAVKGAEGGKPSIEVSGGMEGVEEILDAARRNPELVQQLRAAIVARLLKEYADKYGRVDRAAAEAVEEAVDRALRGEIGLVEEALRKRAADATQGALTALARTGVEQLQVVEGLRGAARAIAEAVQGKLEALGEKASLRLKSLVNLDALERVPLLRPLARAIEGLLEKAVREAVQPGRPGEGAVRLLALLEQTGEELGKVAEEMRKVRPESFSEAAESAVLIASAADELAGIFERSALLKRASASAREAADWYWRQYRFYSDLSDELGKAAKALGEKPEALEAALKLLKDKIPILTSDPPGSAKAVAKILLDYAEPLRKAVEEARKRGLSVPGVGDELLDALGRLEAKARAALEKPLEADWRGMADLFAQSRRLLGDWLALAGRDAATLSALKWIADNAGLGLSKDVYRAYARLVAQALNAPEEVATSFVELALDKLPGQHIAKLQSALDGLAKAVKAGDAKAVSLALRDTAAALEEGGWYHAAKQFSEAASMIEEVAGRGRFVGAALLENAVSDLLKQAVKLATGGEVEEGVPSLRLVYTYATRVPTAVARAAEEGAGILERLWAARKLLELVEEAKKGADVTAKVQRLAAALGVQPDDVDLNLLSDLVERLRRGEVDSARAVRILEALGATGEEGVQLAARLRSLAAELAKGGELTEEGAAALRRAGELVGSLIPGEVEALLRRYGPQLAGFSADVKLYLDLLEKLEPGKGGALHAAIAEAQSSLLKGSLEKLRAGAEAAAWRETVSGTGSYKGVTFRFVRTPEVDEAHGAYTLRTRLELPGGRVAEVVQRVEVDDPSALANLRRWLAGKIPVGFIAEKVYKPVKARVYTTVFYDPPLTGEATAELELIGRIARGDPEALKLLGLEGVAVLLRAPGLPAHLKQLLATILAPGVAGAQQYVQLTVRMPTGELVRLDESTVRELVGRIALSAAGAAREELEQLARQLQAVAPAALLYNIDLKPAAEALAARGVDLSWLRTYGIEPPKPILPVEKPPEVAPKPPEAAEAPEVAPPTVRGEVEKEPETAKLPEVAPVEEKKIAPPVEAVKPPEVVEVKPLEVPPEVASLPVEKPPEVAPVPVGIGETTEVAPKPPEPAGAPEVTPPAARGEVEEKTETVKPPEATPPTEKEKEKEKEERKEEKEKEEKEEREKAPEEREKTKEKEEKEEGGEEVSEEAVVGGEEGEAVSPPDLRGLSFEEIARAIGIAPVGWSVYAVNVRGAWEVRDRLLPEHEWVKPFLEPLLQRDVEYAFFVPAIDADQRVWPLFIFIDPRAWERLRDRIRERTFDLTGAGFGVVTLPVLDVGVEPAPVAGVIESPVQVEGVISELGLPELELQLELEAKEGEPLIPKLTITLPAPAKPAWTPEEGGAVQAAARAPGWGARARQREILVV